MKLRFLLVVYGLFVTLNLAWGLPPDDVITIVDGDRIIAEGSVLTLEATIALPTARAEDVLTVKWYSRFTDEADYPTEPFFTETISLGTTLVSTTYTPIESSYFKVVLNDQYGISCSKEVLAGVATVYKVGFSESKDIYIDHNSASNINDLPRKYVDDFFPIAAHWTKKGASLIDSKPVCYVRNETPKIQMLLYSKGLTPDLANLLKIKATLSATTIAEASYSANLSANTLPLPHAGDGLINPNSGYAFPLTNASAAFPNQIDILEPLTITWEMSDDGGTNWKPLTTTAHITYLTLNTPSFATNKYPFHTTIDISCRKAKGLDGTDLEEVVKRIYTEFTDQTVTTVPYTLIIDNTPTSFGGTVLQFWGNESLTGPQPLENTKDILKAGDGPCGTWARFFMDMLKVQGFTNGNGVNQYSDITTAVTAAQTLPNNSIFTDAILQQAASNPLYNAPYTLGHFLNMPPAAAVFYLKNLDIAPNSFHNVVGGYPGTLAGISGSVVHAQGYDADLPQMTNFTNHALVEFGGKYYDPSYGTTMVGEVPFNSLAEWQTNSVIGYGSFFCPGQSGLDCRYESATLQRIFWFKDNNFNLQEGISGY